MLRSSGSRLEAEQRLQKVDQIDNARASEPELARVTRTSGVNGESPRYFGHGSEAGPEARSLSWTVVTEQLSDGDDRVKSHGLPCTHILMRCNIVRTVERRAGCCCDRHSVLNDLLQNAV